MSMIQLFVVNVHNVNPMSIRIRNLLPTPHFPDSYDYFFLIIASYNSRIRLLISPRMIMSMILLLVVNVHNVNPMSIRIRSLLLIPPFLIIIIIIIFLSLIPYNSHHNSRAQSRETVPAPRR